MDMQSTETLRKIYQAKSVPIDQYVGSQILGDRIYLSSCMPKILISLLTKFPVFGFMVIHSSAQKVCHTRKF